MNSFTFLGMESDFGPHWSMIYLLIPLIFRLAWDAYEIKVLDIEPDHTKHTWITAAVMLFVSLFTWRYGPALYYIQPLILSATIFNQFFDYGLNLLRGEKWNYIDQGTDKKSSLADRAYKFFGWKIVFGFKLWCSLVGFSVYFYMRCIQYGCF